MQTLKGIFPVIPSLFKEDNSLDIDAQRKVTRWALESGAHGVVFPGVASEYNYLSLEERAELLGVVCGEVGDAVPVVGGASAPGADEAVKAGKQAMEYGIRHLMVMAPAGLGQDLASQKGFFGEVAGGLSGATLILQNAPAPVGAGLDAAMMAEIVRGIPSIRYIKEETLPSGPVISALLDSGIPHLDGVLGGGGARYIIDEFERGACAALPAVELTDLHCALYNAFIGGDNARARDLYRWSLPLLVSQAIYRMRLTKYVLGKRGVADNPYIRAPLPELDTQAKLDIDQMANDLEGMLDCPTS